jgi:hypothetical protein
LSPSFECALFCPEKASAYVIPQSQARDGRRRDTLPLKVLARHAVKTRHDSKIFIICLWQLPEKRCMMNESRK